MPNPPPINLGPYVLNAPTEVEKGHIRESLDLGSASLLQGNFLDTNRLVFTDPTNDQRTITLDKTQLNGSAAERLRIARIVNVTGHVTTTSPAPVFDGTEDLYIPVTINDGVISESMLATDAVVGSKIKNGTITPNKLSGTFPDWGNAGTLFIKQPAIELGSGITANGNSFIDFHSSFPLVDYDARIWRRPGVNGALDILNVGTGNINIGGGLSVGSDDTVTSTRQVIGVIEITGNQINTTAQYPVGQPANVEIALNYENSDGTIATFLNTTVFDGKRATVAKFFGDTKTLETYGPCRSITNGQVGWATAGLESRSATGNALVSLHAAGSTATLLRHVRGLAGLEVRDAGDTDYAPLKASKITATSDITINEGSPTLILQDTNHRSGMIHVNSNTFYVLRGSNVNSTTWETINGRWPLEINLENNNAVFGGDVNAGSFTSRSSVRYKKDIVPLQDSLSKVNSLNGVSYVWKDTEKSDVGLIAEEVHEIYPELVHKTSSDEVEGVEYGKLTAVLIEAIKELTKRVVELEKQLEKR